MQKHIDKQKLIDSFAKLLSQQSGHCFSCDSQDACYECYIMSGQREWDLQNTTSVPQQSLETMLQNVGF